MGSLECACGPHGFRYAWDNSLDDSQRGLGGNIPGSHAGAAGGENKIYGAFICPIFQDVRYFRFLVRAYRSTRDVNVS